jgi:hypothetical protein
MTPANEAKNERKGFQNKIKRPKSSSMTTNYKKGVNIGMLSGPAGNRARNERNVHLQSPIVAYNMARFSRKISQ